MSNPEYQLSELIQRLERHRAGRKLLHLHLSRLKNYNKRPLQIGIAANLFERSLRMTEGQLFVLASGDLVFVYKSSDDSDVMTGIDNLLRLFEGDPLIRYTPKKQSNLATVFDLEVQYGEAMVLAGGLLSGANAQAKPLPKSIYADPKTSKTKAKEPINPHRLGELVDTIASADLSNYMRRQGIYILAGQEEPRVVFRELFISIMDLRDQLLPQYDIVTNRWLFQYLTETLDRRMLALLGRHDDPGVSSSFSINLNVSTILSPEFQTFDSKLKQTARGTIVVELQLIDIYADLPTFVFARNFLHSSGYRICLDGISPHNIAFFDRQRLGVDLVKLQWSQDLGEEIQADPKLWQERIEAIGRARAILCHVDNDEAVKLGQSIGFSLFQGRYFDAPAVKVAPPQKIETSARWMATTL